MLMNKVGNTITTSINNMGGMMGKMLGGQKVEEDTPADADVNEQG